MNKTAVPTDILQLFLPDDTLKWFDLIDGSKDSEVVDITLEEKNNPPLPDWYENEKIKSKGFRDITITDFPIRGRTGRLTFRRRTWELENKSGATIRLKRDIRLSADGTTLEKEFADFLKEGS